MTANINDAVGYLTEAKENTNRNPVVTRGCIADAHLCVEQQREMVREMDAMLQGLRGHIGERDKQIRELAAEVARLTAELARSGSGAHLSVVPRRTGTEDGHA